MNSAPETEVDDFLRRFRRGLAALAPDVREDLVGEVRSHLAERLAQGKLDLAGAFGSPEEYASHFVNAEALRAALPRGGPLRLVAVLLARVRATAVVVLVVLPLAMIEIMALALVAIGFLKPFSGGHVGLFLDSGGGFGALGWVSDPGSMREVLGYAAMPIFIFLGLLLFWAGNRLLLRVARRELALMQTGR